MNVLVPVADGSEDMETIIISDVLRRAGIDVTLASIHTHDTVTLARHARLVCDTRLDSLDCQHPWTLIALPGGAAGAEQLRDCSALVTLLRHQHDAGRPLAAICASPALVLAHHGLLEGHRATCHPGFRQPVAGVSWCDERVVTDRLITTSQGPGTAFEFALALVAQLAGEEKRQQVAAPMVL